MPDVVTFDGPNRIIIEIANGTVNEIGLTEIYSEWKVWVTTSDNSKYLKAFTPVGGDKITDIQDLGITYFLENGWRFRPAELNHKVTIVGNLYTRESGQSVFLFTLGNFSVNTETRVSSLVDSSVSRLDLTQLLAAVYIDTESGVPGTADGIGVPTNPVNNIADATVIAERDNIRRFILHGSIVLPQAYDAYTFEGAAAERAAVVHFNGQAVDKCKFISAQLQGAHTGSIEAEACGLKLTTGLSGVFRRCGLIDNFTVGAGVQCVFTDCFSEVPAPATPLCIVTGAVSVQFRNYSGGIEFLGASDTEIITVDCDPALVIVGPTNIAGSFYLSGIGVVVDTNGGANVDISRLVQAPDVLAARDHAKAVNARTQILP